MKNIKKHINVLSTLGLTLLLATGFYGCTKEKPNTPPTQLSANQYLNLAHQAAPEDQSMYKLAAANQYINQKNTQQAQQVLSDLSNTVSPQQMVQKQLLEAKIALLNGQAQAALNTLNQIQGNNLALSDAQQVMLHQLLANTYEILGNTWQSINQRILLQPALTDPQAQRVNLIAIWRSMQTLSMAQLNTQMNNNPSNTIKGWLSLALITKQSKAPNELVENLRQWKTQYPDHPALSLLPANIEQEVAQPSNVKNMALLVPLHGSLAATGEAIRNGFLAAYYAAEKRNINMPHLKIYDTTTQNINVVYQKAVQEGASLVIGPLLKDDLKQLLASGNISVPTLALNTLPDSSRANKNLFQFGLSPLDEAQQAANRAWQHGSRNAVIIASNSEWGQSIAKVFAQTWTSLGGNIVAQLSVSSSSNLAQQISELLQVNLSDQNYDQLHRILRTNIRYVPRRRNDIDVVYLATQPVDARQIVPLLKYYYAGDIPVYSISQIYGGDSSKPDHDLNGVYFCDMPWVLSPGKESVELQQLRRQIETIWPLSYSRNVKLYALGVDAFKIALKLQQIQTMPQFSINGATGELYLDQAQHIYRRLQWARFQNGVPVLLR